jgi:hypothetical protein
MCCPAEKLNELCVLFPQTAENIKSRSLRRRKKFMEQRNTNSKIWKDTVSRGIPENKKSESTQG